MTSRLVLIALMLPMVANAAVTFDATSNAHNISSTPNLSWTTQNIGSGLNRLIVIGCATEATNQTITSVTVGGVAATFFRSDAIGDGSWATGNLEYWYLINPASGNGVSIVVTPTVTPSTIACGAISYAGVDQVVPLRNPVSATGTNSGTNAATVNVTSSTGDMVMAIASCGWNLTPSLSNASGTQRWLIANNANYSAGQTAAGAASVTTSWTVGSGSGGWTITALDIQAAPAGNTYYISTGGNDSNNGTSPTTAWATFGQADSVAVSGDTVRVLSGTYYVGTSGQTADCIHTYSAGVTWTSDTKWGAQVICQAARGANAAIWVIAGDNETVMNFDMSSNNTQNLGLIVYSFSSSPLKGNNALITGNKVHDMPHDGACTDFGDGISVQTSGLTGIVINANIVFNIGPWSTTSCPAKFGITSQGNAVISNNIVYHSSGGGIELHCCEGGGLATNNTLFNNTREGIVVDETSGNTIQNNIIYNNGTISTTTCGIDDYNVPSPGTTITDNLLYGNQPANYCVTDTASSTPTGQITSDPQFVNYQADGSGDYHLTSTSPAIDAGTSTNGPPFDYDGVPRPQGSAWDIGAYEYFPH